jgi:DNA-directed RNA polymerase subunit H (RpoH/RPB5)
MSLFAPTVYKSRRILLEQMDVIGYETREYADFNMNTIASLIENERLDMLLTSKVEPKRKIYVHYELTAIRGDRQINNLLDDLFENDEILTKEDILYIITIADPNDTLKTKLHEIWETYGIFIIVQNIYRLRFNIFNHEFVPKHIILNEAELEELKTKYKITDIDVALQKISRHDPVAKSLCIRPNQVCKIIRKSKTINEITYRHCISDLP